MEHNRKQKLLMIIALVVSIASLSVGFAAFSVSLNISSSASVTPNSGDFSVKFSTEANMLATDAVVPSENEYNLGVTKGVINNSSSPKISGLSVTFTEPGQSVSFQVYVRNEGMYTAYLNGVSELGEKVCKGEDGTSDSLVQSACSEINRTIHIAGLGPVDGEVTDYPLEPGDSTLLNIIFEYSAMGARTDGAFSVSFPDITLVYSSVDDPSIKPNASKVVKLESGDLNTPGSIVSIGDEQFYVYGQENGNVKLLSMYNLYVGNSADENMNVTSLTSPTGIQDKDSKGYNWDSKNNKLVVPFIGTTVFSSDSKKGTNYNDYNGSIVEGYVNNYALYLESFGVNIEDSRLITKEELETLGCSAESVKCGVNDTCSGAPAFVYETSYWVGSAFYGGGSSLWTVINRGASFCGNSYDVDYAFGIRPVIIISISEF